MERKNTNDYEKIKLYFKKMKCLQRLNPQLFEKCVYNVLPRNSLKSVYRRFFYQLRYLTSIYFCFYELNASLN